MSGEDDLVKSVTHVVPLCDRLIGSNKWMELQNKIKGLSRGEYHMQNHSNMGTV